MDYSSPQGWLPVLSLVVASLSLGVAGLSLTWQIAQWVLSSARARVTLMHGLQAADVIYMGAISRKRSTPSSPELLRSREIQGREIHGVAVANVGRASLTVQRVAMRVHRWDVTYIALSAPELLGPSLPRRIDPGENASWYIDTEVARGLAQLARESGGPQTPKIYMSVTLGTGKTIRTRPILVS